MMRLVLLCVALALLPAAHAQQAYPSKPVRLIVPYPPGGTADILGRLLGDKLGSAWSQPVVVENRAGAGGAIGVDLVAKAVPDGYTLVLGVTGPLTIAPSLNPQLPYDPLRDLAPISLVAAVPSIIAVHPSVAANSLRELLDLARSQPGKLTYASTGFGGMPPSGRSGSGASRVHSTTSRGAGSPEATPRLNGSALNCTGAP